MRRRAAALVLFAACEVAPRVALAQAWVPPAGQGSVTLVGQGIGNTGHVLSDGSTHPVGKSRNAALYVELFYAFTDRLSVSAGLPYVFSRYVGPPPPPGTPEPPMVRDVDRCYCWQHDFQDFGATVRFNLLNDATGLTPSVAVGVPSHGYAYAGEAVVGRGLREVRLALDVGRRLDFLSKRLTLSGRYSYAFVETVLDVPNDRSNVSIEAGIRATRSLSLQALLFRQVTHGGLRAGTEPPPPAGAPWGEITTPELFEQHDRLMRDDYWRAGAGIAWDLGGLQVFASYVEFLGGRDTHAGRAFTLGVDVPFGPLRTP